MKTDDERIRRNIWQRIDRSRVYSFRTKDGYRKVMLKTPGHPRWAVARVPLDARLDETAMRELAVLSVLAKRRLTPDEAMAHVLAGALTGQRLERPAPASRSTSRQPGTQSPQQRTAVPYGARRAGRGYAAYVQAVFDEKRRLDRES